MFIENQLSSISFSWIAPRACKLINHTLLCFKINVQVTYTIANILFE